MTRDDIGDRSSGVTPQSRRAVLLAEMRCVMGTISLLFRDKIAMPRHNVGRFIRFADGSRSRIYRETVMRERAGDDPVLVFVRFRLRFIGRSRLGHWLFRRESLFNTLLFAAHRGFETKLWLTDPLTGFYRGVYEWRGQEDAAKYAETLRVVLEPWVERGSFAYHVVGGGSRDDYRDGEAGEEPDRSEDGWWLPMRAAPASR